MFGSWLPWRAALRWLARSQGFLDPTVLLSLFSRFGKRAKVGTPVELLRAGIWLHGRGLINSQAIQHNLDWVWPYWVVRQYDPGDESFTVRGFSLTHINETHRNWTAVGLPGQPYLPLVDPAGLVTPHFDDWSIDVWVVGPTGALLPSRCGRAEQRLDLRGNLQVTTRCSDDAGRQLQTSVSVEARGIGAVCRIAASAESDLEAEALVVSLRPYNPEGIAQIVGVTAETEDGTPAWLVTGGKGSGGDGATCRVELDTEPARWLASRYDDGDVFHRLEALLASQSGAPLAASTREEPASSATECDVGLATAAAVFPLCGEHRQVCIEVPLRPSAGPSVFDLPSAGGRDRGRVARETDHADHALAHAGNGAASGPQSAAAEAWSQVLDGTAELTTPDERYDALYAAARAALVLHTSGDAVPGPFTYRRFWFRDACFMVNGLLAANLTGRAWEVTGRFFARQTRRGFFRSQDGEWDSNGQVLWVLEQLQAQAGRSLPPEWVEAVRRGGRYLIGLREPERPGEPHSGLLPAGFSAEHFGPSDYYYWDDFWAIGGLRAGASLLGSADGERQAKDADQMRAAADQLAAAVERSLQAVRERLGTPAMPSSPYRRLDSSAVGSLAAGYPLPLFTAHDQRLLATADYLHDRCLLDNALFHDMSHSGLNPYLTLHLAQVLLRAGDARFWPLVAAVADIASPTGQWPEAVHPRTRGGCMGDGQHLWAAAEWIIMMRALFVREQDGELVLGAGVPEHWLQRGDTARFGPTPTRFGPITVTVEGGRRPRVHWQARWHGAAPQVTIALQGFSKAAAEPAAANSVELRR